MPTRHHVTPEARSSAVYSACETYRYSLTRVWDTAGPRVTFVMLNPSTADERRNDPTVARCERRARLLGYGGFRVTNLFAIRATDPRDMRAAAAPEGPGNAVALQEGCDWADRVIAAWGVHGAHRGQGPRVAARLRAAGVALFHLGLTREGHPRHPLYLPYSASPLPWEEHARGE